MMTTTSSARNELRQTRRRSLMLMSNDARSFNACLQRKCSGKRSKHSTYLASERLTVFMGNSETRHNGTSQSHRLKLEEHLAQVLSNKLRRGSKTIRVLSLT